jgi:hypothetical protein
MPKKKIKKATSLLRVKEYDSVVNESFSEFETRLQGMPIKMLLSEHQTLCEYFGILGKKDNSWWSNESKAVLEKIWHVKDKIMRIVHSLYEEISMVEYQVDEAYRKLDKKEEKNVKVSKKSTKQNKQS